MRPPKLIHLSNDLTKYCLRGPFQSFMKSNVIFLVKSSNVTHNLKPNSSRKVCFQYSMVLQSPKICRGDGV